MPMVPTDPTSSPHELRYRMQGNDASPALITQATVVATCAAGPLKAYLSGLTTAQFNALLTDMAVDVDAYPAALANPLRVAFLSGTLQIAAVNAANSDGVVSLRFNNSILR